MNPEINNGRKYEGLEGVTPQEANPIEMNPNQFGGMQNVELPSNMHVENEATQNMAINQGMGSTALEDYKNNNATTPEEAYEAAADAILEYDKTGRSLEELKNTLNEFDELSKKMHQSIADFEEEIAKEESEKPIYDGLEEQDPIAPGTAAQIENPTDNPTDKPEGEE